MVVGLLVRRVGVARAFGAQVLRPHHHVGPLHRVVVADVDGGLSAAGALRLLWAALDLHNGGPTAAGVLRLRLILAALDLHASEELLVARVHQARINDFEAEAVHRGLARLAASFVSQGAPPHAQVMPAVGAAGEGGDADQGQGHY